MSSAGSELVSGSIDSALVPSPARFTVLLPPGYDATATSPYPMMYLLHGGDGDNGFLATLRPLIERAWEQQFLPALIVVTPDADRSFYLDYRDGSQRWESFLRDELPAHLRRTYRISHERAGTAVVGISMGGMGALRIAFKNPQLFAAVAALEPGIEPALSFDDIMLRDRFWRSDALFEERYGRPVDRQFWQANNPANLAQNNASALRESKLGIYLEAGDEDSFHLHYGSEFLHRLLFDAGIKHEYRLVRGADHLGRTLGPRFLDAFAFVGRILNPAAPDDSLAEFHRMIAALKRNAGYRD